MPVLTSHQISQVMERQGKLDVSTGNGQTFETEHIIAATGYKVDLRRLAFLDETLRSEIKTFNGSPQLDATFESSAPGLYFVGIASAQSFGPLMRFVYGAKHAATILARHVRAATPARSRAVEPVDGSIASAAPLS